MPSPEPPLLLPEPLAPFSPEFFASLPAQTQIISNLVQNVQLVALNTAGNPPLLNNIQGGVNLPPQPPVPTPTPGAGGRQILPGLDRRIVDIPPPGETRMIQDEVVVQIATRFGPDQLQNAVRRLGLTVIASETLTSTGSTVVRLRITDGRTPAQAIRSLANVGMAAIVQPNYVYALQQQSGDPTPSARGDTGQQGDPAQYILEKLKISDVHRLARGTNVPIAVIDSQIDAEPPRSRGRDRQALQRGRGRGNSRTRTAPAWRARLLRTSGSSGRRPPPVSWPCTPSPPAQPPRKAPRSISSRAWTGR